MVLYRNSTNVVLNRLLYVTKHKRNDLVCEVIRKHVELLKLFPKDFGREEEISIIERVSHPSLTSEEQIYEKKKGVPKKLIRFLTGLLETYEELGKLLCFNKIV